MKPIFTSGGRTVPTSPNLPCKLPSSLTQKAPKPSTWLLLVILLYGTLVSYQQVHACDRSSFTLDSIDFDSATGNYHLYTTLCAGGGVLGSAQGADNSTSSIFFFAYGDSTLNFVSYPSQFTSDSTNCTLNVTPLGSINVGPLAGTRDALRYSSSSCTYTCVTSTPDCGRPHSDCRQMLFVMSGLPDSIRAWGVEGTGNPFAGCTDIDMTIFPRDTILPVEWGQVQARAQNNGVEVTWTTLSETNALEFSILRSADGHSWQSLGRLPAKGDTQETSRYEFSDASPFQGTNHYRIRQFDLDGSFTQSPVVSTIFRQQHGFAWQKVGPVPESGRFEFSFTAAESGNMDLQVLTLDGTLQYRQTLHANQGLNEVEIDLSRQVRGVYILRLSGLRGTIFNKVIKS